MNCVRVDLLLITATNVVPVTTSLSAYISLGLARAAGIAMATVSTGSAAALFAVQNDVAIRVR